MAVPKGIIVLWRGTIGSIPSGWFLCDGNNSTPDLRDRFVVAAGVVYDPGDTGGANTHKHDFTGDGHTHHLPAGTDLGFAFTHSDLTSSDPATGTTDNASSLPFYYALAYIMKS